MLPEEEEEWWVGAWVIPLYYRLKNLMFSEKFQIFCLFPQANDEALKYVRKELNMKDALYLKYFLIFSTVN